MHTIAVVNQKGGVGKTTTAVNLGAALALLGHEVLVVDLDPQAAASAWLGHPAAPDVLSAVYVEDRPIRDAIVPTTLPRLSLAPSSGAFARVEAHLYAATGGEAALRASLSSVATSFAFTLLDCPPNLGRVSASALMAASRVLVPVSPSALDVRAVPLIFDTMAKIARYYNDRLTLLGLLATRTDHTRNSRVLIDWCATTYPHYLLSARIRHTVRLREAAMHAQPVQLYDGECFGAQDYNALAVEVCERVANPPSLMVSA